MKNKNLILTSFIHGLITVAYVSLVAWLMFNGEQWFDKADTFWMPFVMLLLFILSAAIVGYLVVGKPIQLYIDNQKKSHKLIILHHWMDISGNCDYISDSGGNLN